MPVLPVVERTEGRTGEMDRHLVVRLVHRGGIAERRPDELGAVDQALGPEEADRELFLEARSAHGDRDRDRLLAGTGGADLERLFADDAVAAELQRRAADGHDPGRRHVPGRRGDVLHGASVEGYWGKPVRRRMDRVWVVAHTPP